jgi:sec-independent protein translocase protein TatA
MLQKKVLHLPKQSLLISVIGLMNHLLLIGTIGAGEILLIALVVLLFWGGKKIPELMKGLGKGVKSFKDGMNEIEKDINEDTSRK